MDRVLKRFAFAWACLAGFLCVPASAQTIELRLSHWGGPTHVNQKVFVPWAEMVAKKWSKVVADAGIKRLGSGQ